MSRSCSSLVIGMAAVAVAAAGPSHVHAQDAPAAQTPPSAQTPAPPLDPQSVPDPNRIHRETVITVTGRPEPVDRIAGTVQIIHQDRIQKSTARSLADLLAENAVGFMSEFTPGQTSINIRGAATEGQGRDFRSQVLVLINGHRAGTANLAKLSPNDVQRIEIVRGPTSVVYGSQNMGGVINIILKTGRTAPGNYGELAAGSWDLVQGVAQSGGVINGFDYYLGVGASKRGEYQVGGGKIEENTAWTRGNGAAAFGYQIDADNRIDMTVRSDGIYDAGFRGSSANIYAFDTRYNRSIDFSYTGKVGSRGSLYWQGYFVQDVDDLNNPSPLSALNAVASRTTVDHNRRALDIMGSRFQPSYNAWEGNQLLLGIDWERSTIRSNRNRAGGRSVTQLSPQDNNQTENVWAFYLEDSQSLLEDKLVVRGGVRQTFGTTALDWTPFATTLVPGSNNYTATTYSTGATYAFTDWMSGRIGTASGFRAPTATELGANFTTTPIGTTIFGNPNLSPETSQQVEMGATFNWIGGRIDTVIFQNVIANRIAPITISSTGGRISQLQVNNPGNIVVQGAEFQAEVDMMNTLKLAAKDSWNWKVFGNGYYNFKMTDYGAQPGSNSSQATRINQYGMDIGTQFGQSNVEMPWNFQLLGILRGPIWYNTEESLSAVYFPGQVRNTTVYQKDPFWIWKARGELEVAKGVKMFAALNNIFDVNAHPLFIATDQNPCVANRANQNGACGNSMMGREVIIGFQFRF
jgi:vitamin B12 transporter